MIGPKKKADNNSVATSPGEAMPLASCLAKTWWNGDSSAAGRTVEEHCRIAGAVAQTLLDRLFAAWPAGREVFPQNAELAPLLHDTGKICPTFQKKIHAAIGDDGRWPQLKDTDPAIETGWGKHAAVSYAAFRDLGLSDNLAWCVGRHHGHTFQPRAHGIDPFGGQPWARARLEFMQALRAGKSWPVIGTETERLLVTGLTVVSDWIASGDIFSDPAPAWPDLVESAVDQAGFIYPAPIQNLSFEDIFGFSPNDTQKTLATTVTGPGVYILEAPMGSGKTEAALYAAYQLLATGKACGLYFALPTQLTSNKIHKRVSAFLDRALSRPSTPILAHADAWLGRLQNQLMGGQISPGGEWFEHGPRAILAPYAVGTVDQALMAAINTRWAGLRLFGLAGKVVILDEIHSYDAYTGALLDALASHLAAMSSTVIILSATLTRARRDSLLTAARASGSVDSVQYPLLSHAVPGEQAATVAPSAGKDSQVSIILEDQDERALEEVLDRAASGQQTLWIENTVHMAQTIFRKLAARASGMDIDVGLLHSRFVMEDRANNEALWTELLGKAGGYGDRRREDRGRILIGTQVVEQSLDIDADFLVTRFAPTELILQRLGRLWRHDRPARAATARREAILLAPPLASVLAAPAKMFAETGTSAVYDAYTLARSLEVWQNRPLVNLPGDIRLLIEASCASREEPEGSPMRRAAAEAQKELEIKKGLALQSQSSLNSPLDEHKASTRLAEVVSVKVLLLDSLDIAKGVCRLTEGGETLHLSPPAHGQKKLEIAAALAMRIVKVPENAAPAPAPDAVQKLFSPYIHIPRTKDGKYDESQKLRVLLLDKAGQAHDVNNYPLEGIYNNSRVGYSFEQARNAGAPH